MALRGNKAQLSHDDELQVLWLQDGSQELALSADGVWLRSGRKSLELTWAEIEQVQATSSVGGLRRERQRIEVFVHDGHVHVIGPFPSQMAEQWVEAAADAAAGEVDVARLQGASGFATRA